MLWLYYSAILKQRMCETFDLYFCIFMEAGGLLPWGRRSASIKFLQVKLLWCLFMIEYVISQGFCNPIEKKILEAPVLLCMPLVVKSWTHHIIITPLGLAAIIKNINTWHQPAASHRTPSCSDHGHAALYHHLLDKSITAANVKKVLLL